MYLSSSFRLSAFTARILVAILAFHWWTPLQVGAQAPPPDQQSSDLAAVYNAAQTAFQQGQWEACIKGLETVAAQVTDPKAQGALHPLYFTLGAAYFNLPDYPKAIATFQTYLQKYPNADKVIDVRLALAKAQYFNKDYEAAIQAFTQIEAIPQYREQALNAQAQAYKELGKVDDAIAVYDRMIKPEIKTPGQATAAIRLAELYAGKNDPEKAVGLLALLQTKTGLVDNLVALNALAVKLGDEFAEKKLYGPAIAAYRAVRMRDQVLKFQSARIEAMEKKMESNLAGAKGNPQLYVQMSQANTEIKATQAEAKQLLGEFEKLPDFAPALLLRMARCWYDWDKKWEAMVVFDRILTKYPSGAEREPALYGSIVASGDVNQVLRCQKLCQQYLEEFPTGPNAGTVGYLSGAVALQVNDAASAANFFGIMLEKQPNSEFREQMRFLLGNANLMQGKFDDALKQYNEYLKEFPRGENAEEVSYRIAVSHLFSGKLDEARPKLEAYLAQNPKGHFAADAKYRIMVCKYAAEEMDAVIADAKAWLAEYPGDRQEGEVLAIYGDALVAQDNIADALPLYIDSYKKATTDEVLNYGIFEAAKHMQKLGKWEELSKMFEDFVREKPDHPSVVAAIFWIGKARAREGKTDEAKQFLVDTLQKYITDPKREAVEQLLAQLAQFCMKRPRPAPAPAALASAAPAAATGKSGSAPATPAPAAPAPPPPPPWDAEAELEKRLAPLAENKAPLAQARVQYARAELAQLRRKPADREKILAAMADQFKPEDFSPMLLAQVGDHLLAKGESDRAAALFERLKEEFPNSEVLDFAYVGLGEIAFSKKQYDKALQLFTDAAEKLAASMKMKDATIGRAKTLLELGRYDESKKYFEQVASIREWRGESTALAVFSLGEIEARQGRWAEAIAHYRRVFVAYQKYLPLVAKSYLRAADSFLKMGQTKDAVENLKEMLRNEKLSALPEAQEARTQLAKLGGGPA